MIPSLMQQKPECFSIRLLLQYDSSMSNIALKNCIYMGLPLLWWLKA